MNHLQFDDQAVNRLCCGNREAWEWIQFGRLYVHEIDDLIDEDLPKANRIQGAERVCRIGAMAIKLYTHPFFLKHIEALRAVMLINTNNYADSVKWEKSDIQWRRNFSDWARHGWLDVILVVAEICGGYEHMRSESAELRAMSYVEHHDAGGKES